MATDSVAGSIIDRIEATAGLTSIYGSSPTRAFKDEEPQNVALPFLVVTEESSDHEHIGGFILERVGVRIDAFAQGQNTLDSHMGTLVDTIKRGMTALSFSTATKTMKDIRLTDRVTELDRTRSTALEPVVKGMLTYEVTVQRSL